VYVTMRNLETGRGRHALVHVGGDFDPEARGNALAGLPASARAIISHRGGLRGGKEGGPSAERPAEIVVMTMGLSNFGRRVGGAKERGDQ